MLILLTFGPKTRKAHYFLTISLILQIPSVQFTKLKLLTLSENSLIGLNTLKLDVFYIIYNLSTPAWLTGIGVWEILFCVVNKSREIIMFFAFVHFVVDFYQNM